MGLLVEGSWQDRWYDTKKSGGRFERSESAFRNWVTADGSAGPSGADGFRAKPGRYHLYVSLACPWAHRVLIMRRLKGLESMIGVSVVHWHMADQGWTFEQDDAARGDALHGARYLHQIYTRARSDYTGRVTVPVLWDIEQDTIVSNESSEIIRMLGSAFDAVGAHAGDYYPERLRPVIDPINERVYRSVNNGVYRSGFATTQQAYEEAVRELFEALDWLEGLLAERRFLAGDEMSEADIRLFTTAVRFDPVYHGHFKCNLRPLSSYPNLWAWTREIYQLEAVRPTVNMAHIKKHYYGSHGSINPTGIVPLGPELDFDAPHYRN